jgi:type IV pilus assembly protein PilW
MPNNNKGFTLIELLVAMAISVIVMAGVYSVYYSQQKSYVAQEQVAAMQQNLRAGMFLLEREIRMAGMQQNLRAGMFLLEREIRMAGYDKADSNLFGFRLSGSDGRLTDANNIYFTVDRSEDGVVNNNDDEQIAFRLNAGNLQKYSTGAVTWQTIAENIDALDFVYLAADGSVTGTPASIRSAQITLVARTGRGDPGYTNNEQFYNQNPDGQELIYTAPGDDLRRKRLTVEIKCRNLWF